jgi:hypothetical protein
MHLFDEDKIGGLEAKLWIWKLSLTQWWDLEFDVIFPVLEAELREQRQIETEFDEHSQQTIAPRVATVRNLIRAALFPQKVGGSTKNRTLFKLVRSFHWYEIAAW